MESRFLLDTKTIIYIRRSRPTSVMQAFAKLEVGATAMSVITLGELICGVAKSPQREAAMSTLQKLAQFVQVLPFPEAAANFYGMIRAELELKGQMIRTHDLWIAAHALAAGLILVTNNEREFRRVKGLKIQNWARQ